MRLQDALPRLPIRLSIPRCQGDTRLAHSYRESQAFVEYSIEHHVTDLAEQPLRDKRKRHRPAQESLGPSEALCLARGRQEEGTVASILLAQRHKKDRRLAAADKLQGALVADA